MFYKILTATFFTPGAGSDRKGTGSETLILTQRCVCRAGPDMHQLRHHNSVSQIRGEQQQQEKRHD